MLVHLDALRAQKGSGRDGVHPSYTAARRNMTFAKNELNAILSLYSFYVAKGKWHDYAIDFMVQMAAFSIFRHSSEQPLVCITKTRGNTASGHIYEIFFEKKRIARSGELDRALETLQELLQNSIKH